MKLTATKFGTLAFAASLFLGVSTSAQTLSYVDYQNGKAKIKANYKAEKKSCAALVDNAKDICEEQVEGNEDIAKAELYERYKPSAKSHYKVQIAKAEAIYEVSKERCDNLDDKLEDLCVKEARGLLTTA